MGQYECQKLSLGARNRLPNEVNIFFDNARKVGTAMNLAPKFLMLF